MPLISNCSMMPVWHQLVSMSGHVEESETAGKLQLYATSIYQDHSFVCQLDYQVIYSKGDSHITRTDLHCYVTFNTGNILHRLHLLHSLFAGGTEHGIPTNRDWGKSCIISLGGQLSAFSGLVGEAITWQVRVRVILLLFGVDFGFW